MLTPQEITDKAFVKAVFGGYDMTGVDDFLESLAADYSALYKENAILKSKIKVLVEKVEEYRSTEDAMRMALLTAQKMGDDIMTDANKKSTEALARVDDEIQQKFSAVEGRIADEEARLKAAANETARFIQASNELIRRHSDFLSKIGTIRREPEPEPVPPPAPTRAEQIVDAAKEIDSAVEKILKDVVPEFTAAAPVAEPAPEPVPVAPYIDETEPTRPFHIKLGAQQEEPQVTPRPKFDFDNLQFGANVNQED